MRDRLLRPLVRVLGWPLAAGGTRVEPADAIVVLGAPLAADGGVTHVLVERIRAAIRLRDAGVAPLIAMTGGRTRGAAVAEAEAMAAWARTQGVPETALLVEGESATTYENAKNLAGVLLPRGMSRVVLVTTPFHLRRSVRWFRKFGFAAVGYHIEDSFQYREPLRGLRWIGREYVSWVVTSSISAVQLVWPRFMRSREGR
jgi:uncharacterized SAM-binding protein YcdF (DUF218 family)